MTLAQRVFTISGWTFLSRILGLIRDRLFAGLFGASLVLDAFLMAFQLPNLLRNLFGEGALSAAFIPRYVQMRAQDPDSAERFAGAVLTRLFLGLSVLAGAAMIVAAALMPILPDRYALVAYLAIPQLPFLAFICVAAIMAGVLNGRRHFFVPAAAPVVLNLCLIGTVFLDPEQEIWYLPYAVLVAGISQVILHGWALRKTGGVPPLALRSSPELKELRRSVLPVLISSSIFQFNAFLDTVIAYVFLGVSAPGAVAILYFGNRLLQFPMALITHGVGTAAYPDLAEAAKEGWQKSGDGLRKASSLLWFFLLPAAVGLLVTAEPLVRTIYQTGSFGDESVRRTILVTQFFALALVPISLCKLQVRAFHAHRDQRTPMRVSLFTVLVNLGLNVFLVQTPLREAGLALATAIASTLGCAIYAVLLGRRGAGALLTNVAWRRPIIGTLVMGTAVWTLLHYWPQPVGGGSVAAVLRLLSATGLGAAVYFGIAHFLRSATQERP
jgi:putative peptidoglycan lipid II flippase